MNLLFSLLLTLSLFHGSAFAKFMPPTPTCASLLKEHLATRQPFQPLARLPDALAARESATVLFESAGAVSSLDLPASSGLKTLSNFSAGPKGPSYFVLSGARTDLLAAHVEGAMGFQVLGSRSATRTFTLPYPEVLFELTAATPKAVMALDELVARETRSFGVFAAKGERLAFVIARDDLAGITTELLEHIGVRWIGHGPGRELGAWLETADLQGATIAAYRDRFVVTQAALHRLKTLTGKPIDLAPVSDVDVSAALLAELKKCEGEVCAIPVTPTLRATLSARPPLADEYPVIDQPQLSVDEMKEISKFLRDTSDLSINDAGVLPDMFIGLLDQIAPEDHATHERLIRAPAINWGQRDYNNGFRVASAQRRILTAWRVLADRVLGTKAPERLVDIQLVREVIAKFAKAAVAAEPPTVTVAAEEPLDLRPFEFTRKGWAIEEGAKTLFGPEHQSSWSKRPLALIRGEQNDIQFLLVQDAFARTMTPVQLVEQLEAASGVGLSRTTSRFVTQAMTDPALVEVRAANSTTWATGLRALADLRATGAPVYLVPKGDLDRAPEGQQRVLLIPLVRDQAIKEAIAPAPAAKPARPLSITFASKLRYRVFIHDPKELYAFLEKYREYALPTGQNELSIIYCNQRGRTTNLLTFTYDADHNEVHVTQIEEPDAETERQFWYQVSVRHGFDNVTYLYPWGQGVTVDGHVYHRIRISARIRAKLFVKHDLDDGAVQAILALTRNAKPDGRGFAETVTYKGKRYLVGLRPDDRGNISLMTIYDL